MTLADCKKLADQLFMEHELDGWSFYFDSSVKRFGQCRHSLREISMSRKLVELNTPERVKLTMLHEIAHAIVGAAHGHNANWKRVCKQIGGDGIARYSIANTETPQLKFYANCLCPNGNYQRARRPKPYAQYFCRKCRTDIEWRSR